MEKNINVLKKKNVSVFVHIISLSLNTFPFCFVFHHIPGNKKKTRIRFSCGLGP